MTHIEEWFKIKKYPHIGKPITIKDYDKVRRYVSNPIVIKKHSFLPFLHKTIVKRKYRPDTEVTERNPSGKKCRKKQSPKERPISFASHLDAMVFSKYSSILGIAYERYLEQKPFSDSIVAYRKIPVVTGEKPNKCNIHFAESVFEYIKNNKDKKLSVIVADITSFFDNLNHRILKQKWAEILGVKSLPDDHYNVYKALTRIRLVEEEQLFKELKQLVYVEKGVPNNNKEKEIIQKKVKSRRYFKKQNVVYYCEKEVFLKNHLNLIISKSSNKGIPQGTPISATLANIYMLDFDAIVYNRVKECGGYYQRYSDDLIIVCEQQYEDELLSVIKSTVDGEKCKLEISPEKTKLYRFEVTKDKFMGCLVDMKTKVAYTNRSLEYLGFYFDGQRVLIKSSGLSKYYRSMKGAFNRSVSFARYAKNKNQGIFKGRLFKRFTYRGAKPHFVYRQSESNPQKYKKTKKRDRGNYLTYVYKADKVMQTINQNNEIKKQSRKFWNHFNKLMKASILKSKKRK